MIKPIDLDAIKLSYKDTPGTGKEIFAFHTQEFNCVEFTTKANCDQPITYTPTTPRVLVCERWMQFAPQEWKDFQEAIFTEMVRLWNEHHNKE
jgi:hypothetical protein